MSSEIFVKNNLISSKLHSKEQHHEREQICALVSALPSLLRVNGSSVAATAATCVYQVTGTWRGNTTRRPIRDRSVTPPDPGLSQRCRSTSAEAALALEQSECPNVLCRTDINKLRDGENRATVMYASIQMDSGAPEEAQ